MSFLRAVRSHNLWRARALAQRLECLHPFRELEERGGPLEAALRQLEEKAMQLARKNLAAELRREQEQNTDNQIHEDPNFRAQRRGQVMAKLARLKPGTNTTLGTMIDESRQRVESTAEKLAYLRRHWAAVFKAKRYDQEAARQWLGKAYPNSRNQDGFPNRYSHDWDVRPADIEKAINLAGASAPGPDGIPYAMWKQLGRPAVQMIWEVAQELHQPEAEATLAAAYRDEHHCGFNEGLLVFIPKKPSATDEYGELCFQASDARPICIVDTANRLIANAARLRWESLLAS
jgi:hypothetical protein